MTHLVSALGPGASLLALDPALLGDAVLVEHVAGLLHELADGGVVLAVLGVVGVVGSGGGAVGVVSTVGASGGAANAGAGGGCAGGVAAGGGVVASGRRLVSCQYSVLF